MCEPPRIRLHFEDAFESYKDATPLFLTNQGIKGSLKLSGVSSTSVVVKFTFSGYLINSIGFDRTRYMTPPNLSLKKAIYECSIVQEVDSSTSSCDVPFHFPFDRRFLRCEELFEKDVIFPPSLEVNSLKLGQRGGYAKVHYAIKAVAMSDGVPPTSTIREIRVVDETVPHSPPMWLEGFGEEYVCCQQRTLKNLLGLPQGQLIVTAPEPQPIEIHGSQNSTWAQIPLKFTYQGSPPTGTIVKSWSAGVDWSLKASTFVSTVATRSVPTVAQAQKSLFMRVVEDTISTGQISKMNITFRREEKLSSSGPRVWTAESLLSLDILPQRLPAPTIWSKYLSRRYHISLLIKPSGEGTCSFELNIPVQITYSGDTQMLSPVRDRGSIDTVLPQYVK